jgi:transcriptional regulator with XRE-family HTH domain
MITPDQCRAARILARVSALELATSARVGIATIKRFESGQPVQSATIQAVEKALNAAGIVFVAEGERSESGGAGVRLASGEP